MIFPIATATWCPSFFPMTFISSEKTWEGRITAPGLSSNTVLGASALWLLESVSIRGVFGTLLPACRKGSFSEHLGKDPEKGRF
jgi:hypothetical protein